MGLARSCLTVGHDHTVEAVEHIANDRCCNMRVRLVLACVHLKNAVKAEVTLVKTRANKRQRLVVVWVVRFNALHAAFLTALCPFTHQEWSNADYHYTTFNS